MHISAVASGRVVEHVSMKHVDDSENQHCLRGFIVDQSVVAFISLYHKRYQRETELGVRAPIRAARGVGVGMYHLWLIEPLRPR